MTRTAVNRISYLAPLVLSALAFALVTGNIVAGVKPTPDEGSSAHLFQLLIGLQAPLIVTFLLTSKRGPGSLLPRLVVQLLAIVTALAPVWLAGY